MICSETHRRVAARCFEELVFYDYDRGTSTEIPDYMLSQLIERYDKQELHMETTKGMKEGVQEFVLHGSARHVRWAPVEWSSTS